MTTRDLVTVQTSASTQTGGGGHRDHPSVRSAQSLSSKYTAGPTAEAKSGVRKNASLCVRSEQVGVTVILVGVL